jgi:hypothetical protein
MTIAPPALGLCAKSSPDVSGPTAELWQRLSGCRTKLRRLALHLTNQRRKSTDRIVCATLVGGVDAFALEVGEGFAGFGELLE